MIATYPLPPPSPTSRVFTAHITTRTRGVIFLLLEPAAPRTVGEVFSPDKRQFSTELMRRVALSSAFVLLSLRRSLSSPSYYCQQSAAMSLSELSKISVQRVVDGALVDGPIQADSLIKGATKPTLVLVVRRPG